MPEQKIILKNSGFGQRLRFLREKANLSQTELAKQLRYKRSSSISNFENEKVPPDVTVLAMLAEVFNINLHWLITGTPSPDGKVWRSNYTELLRKFHTDAGEWLDRLESEVKDLQAKCIEITENDSRGGTVKAGELERYKEEIAVRQSKVDRIRKHIKWAFELYEGVHVES